MALLIIRNAEIRPGRLQDVLIDKGRISRIADAFPDEADDQIDAKGGALLPGLNDHHLHLASLAIAKSSVDCGPPTVCNPTQLSETLRSQAAGHKHDQWVRGINYHESVAGDIDAAWLDACVNTCPLRVQHRGGRLWVFNSRALELLAPKNKDPFERVKGRLTGRLIDGDEFLRSRLRSQFPDLSTVSRELAGFGITGVTDTTPQNNWETLAHFNTAKANGQLQQSLRVMGNASLDESSSVDLVDDIAIGAHKFHLLESKLPDLDTIIAAIKHSHSVDRNVAFHCVTRTELVFALAAIAAAECLPGDRIEHASVAPPETVEQMRELGLTVVTQPVFVRQRGDQYLRDVAREDQPWLYRLKGLLDSGICLAGSSDAPFGSINPWLAMHAAVTRTTQSGATLEEGEALTPEQALALYASPLESPGKAPPPLQEGQCADLCLLSTRWSVARANLQAVEVQLTLKNGQKCDTSPSG